MGAMGKNDIKSSKVTCYTALCCSSLQAIDNELIIVHNLTDKIQAVSARGDCMTY